MPLGPISNGQLRSGVNIPFMESKKAQPRSKPRADKQEESQHRLLVKTIARGAFQLLLLFLVHNLESQVRSSG